MLGLLELCESGTIEMVASAAHQIENLQNPDRSRRAHAEEILSAARHRADVSREVELRAAHFADAGLTRLDALHMSAAVAANAAYFCTTDDKLARRGRRLNLATPVIVTPIELALILIPR